MVRKRAVPDLIAPIRMDSPVSTDFESPSRTSLTVGVLEAAGLMHVHPNRVLEMIAAGTLPAAKIGRAWVMLHRDVLDFVERQIIEQTGARLAARRTRQ